jgi:hypothetical protein
MGLGDEQAVVTVVHGRLCRRRAGSGYTEREEAQGADFLRGAYWWEATD